MKRIFIIGALIGGMYCSAVAQTGMPREIRKAYAAPEEIVSFSQTTRFSDAIGTLNDLSKKYLNKIIVDPETRSIPIGIDINRLHWLTALELILKKNGLWYQQYPDYYKIHPLGENLENLSKEELLAIERYNKREVTISAVFFEADVSKLREMGMSWLLKKGTSQNLSATNISSGGIKLQDDSQTGGNTGNSEGGGEEAGKLFQLKLEPPDFLSFEDATFTFDALENNNAGEIIARPQVTVGSGEEGKIQVGSDIAVTVQDFAGNSVTQFFSTGSIIKVKPEVVYHDSVQFIYIELQIERSSSSRDAQGGLEIRKSLAETRIMLLDGEETVIGGLYVNEESNRQAGVPILKDLPWWFFGLRYLFGYESKSIVKKELLILIKAELLPTLENRFKAKLEGNEEKELLRKSRMKTLEQMKQYREQLEKKE